MGQGDILKILEKNKDKWFSSKELAEITKVKSCGCSLRKLADRGEILKKFKNEGGERSKWFNGKVPFIYKAK